ncbi:MAG: WhiB family transcriptional regulator [Acidimicrobiales bacterium]
MAATQENPLLWQERAACRGPLGSVFFPPPVTERKREKLSREARAKEICQGCPVLADCREYALSIREPHGVWGGLSEQERRTLLAS